MQVYGIDLSMKKFDVNFENEKGEEKKKEVKNKVMSISNFLNKVPKNTVLCAEHTGVYGDLLVFLCNQQDIPIALVPGYTVKHSLGLVKGKSDPIDARRLREYGERFYDKLKFEKYDTEVIFELTSLHTLRKQLVKSHKMLLTGNHSREQQPMQSIKVNKYIQQALQNLENEIEQVENEIQVLIQNTQELKENFDYVSSINGFGPVITTELIIKTGNFKGIDTAKKASSYAGVCPFPNSSGKFVRKSKTSPFADKDMKTLLFMGAKTAIQHNPEYILYYKRKSMEGKHHYLIMNNVANKMLRTAYSLVRNKTMYQTNFVRKDPREENNMNSSSKKVA